MNNYLNTSMNNLMPSSSSSINSIEKNNSFEAKKKRVHATLERNFQKKTETNNLINIEQDNILIETTNKNDKIIKKRNITPSKITNFFKRLKNKFCCGYTNTTNKKVIICYKSKGQEQDYTRLSITLEPVYHELESSVSQDENIYDEPYQNKY